MHDAGGYFDVDDVAADYHSTAAASASDGELANNIYYTPKCGPHYVERHVEYLGAVGPCSLTPDPLDPPVDAVDGKQ